MSRALADSWPDLGRAFGRPETVLAYQPTRFEPDPRALIRRIQAEGVVVLVPRPHGDHELEWIRVGEAHLENRQTSIPRPEGDPVAIGTEPLYRPRTLVIAPALAVDPRSGLRLGQGAGFYDRLLARARAERLDFHTATVVFDSELRNVPQDPHDQAVDGILTESGLRLVRDTRG